MYAPVPSADDDLGGPTDAPPRRAWRRASYGGSNNVFCCDCALPAWELTPQRRNLAVSYLAGIFVRPTSHRRTHT
jgi:hypothetical protein